MGLYYLANLIHLIFYAMYLIVIAGVLLSWVEVGFRGASWLYSPPINLVRELSFQIIRPFRNFLERVGLRTGPIDFSPILAILAINLLGQLVDRILGFG
jgi:YggT family protein